MECAVDLEGGEVVGEIEFVCRVGRVDDKVELEFPGFGPAFFVGYNEVFCAELEGIFFLVG